MDYYSPSTNRGEGREEGRANVGEEVDGCGGRKVYILHVKLCLRDTNISREQMVGVLPMFGSYYYWCCCYISLLHKCLKKCPIDYRRIGRL